VPDLHDPRPTRLSHLLSREQMIHLCVRYNVPIHNADGLLRYFADHIPPGSFLLAVLCNDLKAACMCADETNRHHIFNIVHLLSNEAPAGSFGSLDQVNAWTTMEVPSRG
jgi:hypothetical protein